MLKIAVIGTGHLGKIHTKLWKEVEGVELVGIFDSNREEAARVAAEHGVRSFENTHELIEAAEGISIVTPTFAHFEISKQAITAGKHVLIEKPITSSIAEADELIALANKHQAKIQVGHIERFNPALLAIEKFIHNPMFFESHRLAQFKPRGTDVAVVLDLMIHDIDVILSLARSEVTGVDASGVSVVSDEIDIANARIKFSSGAVANVTASRISQNPMRKLRIFERDAYLSVDFAAKSAEVFHLVGSDEAKENRSLVFNLGEIERAEKKLNIIYERPDVPDLNPLKYELELFRDAITKDTVPIVSGEDGQAALRVAELIMESIRKNSSIGQ
ncbi:MAG: Gfo/Idh/MocA family oxidoreductase [Bacteroidota bacterium]|nr:Gfo/Idh/MocA family oxidoreductase [Bacteroidota bacterium]MDP4229677.1 Gfo/Idh/MocA family oxidoreductase [Bacteroidota bacterium]MDP4235052.1 Gfo/Idh/MocA family oxidoreductase [Bacteroidota bacterium]